MKSPIKLQNKTGRQPLTQMILPKYCIHKPTFFSPIQFAVRQPISLIYLLSSFALPAWDLHLIRVVMCWSIVLWNLNKNLWFTWFQINNISNFQNGLLACSIFQLTNDNIQQPFPMGKSLQTLAGLQTLCSHMSHQIIVVH